MQRRTFSVLLENKPGILARVTAVLTRRGFIVDALTVAPTENPDVSIMTIVVKVDDSRHEQVSKQLNKLVNVLEIVELEAS
jgi:acetolactate synthase I/III small subunit